MNQELIDLYERWEREAGELSTRSEQMHKEQSDLHAAYLAGKSAGCARCASELRDKVRP